MPDFERSAKNLLENYASKLKRLGFNTSTIENGQFNFQIDVTNSEGRIKLLIYYSRKGNKIVLQGNQELELYRCVNDVIFGEQLFSNDDTGLIEPEIYIGTDESGKGDYFGPLVVSAVFTDKSITEKLKAMGVKDSKELSDQVITTLAKRIKKLDDLVFDIIIINPEKYNLLYNKFGNLNKLLGWAHAKALENILEVKSVPEAISDKFGNEKYIHDSLQEKGKDILLHQVTKAEKYTAVAAASILARDIFNKWFYNIKNKYNFELPKGASETVELKAKEIIKKFGNAELNKFAKLHFKTTKKL